MPQPYALTDTAWVNLGGLPLSLESAPVSPRGEPGSIHYVLASSTPALSAVSNGTLSSLNLRKDLAGTGLNVYARAADGFGAIASVLSSGSAGAAAATPGTLTLSSTTMAQGTADGVTIATISGVTANSILRMRATNKRFRLVGNLLVAGNEKAGLGDHKITLLEFAPGATEAKFTTFTITVEAAAVATPVLKTLTLSNNQLRTNSRCNSEIGQISGRSAGSTIVLSPDNGTIVYGDGRLFVGSVPSTAGSVNYTLTETLDGVSKSNVFSLITTLVDLTVSNTPAPSVLGPTSASFTVGAASGSPVAAITGLSAGETATSISPNDGRLAIASGGNLVVGLTASSAGTTSYTITTSAGRTISIAVSAVATVAPIAISGANGTATVGNTASFTPTISGGTASYTVAATDLPPGRTITNAATGLTTGAYTTAGTYNATYTVTDSAGATASFTRSVVVSAAGAFLTASSTAPIGYGGTDRLNPSYTGPALRVVRASDTAQQDIRFTGDSLDTATATTFAGSSYLTVMTVYNQDGTGNHFTTMGDQPRLWLGEGGPTIESYSSAMPFAIPAAISVPRANCSVFVIGRTPGLGATNAYFSFGSGSVDLGLTSPRTAGQVGSQPMVAGASTSATTGNKATLPVANMSIVGLVSEATKITVHRDEQTAVFPAAAALTMNAGGQMASAVGFTGRHSLRAFAIYPAALPDADTTAVKAALKSIFGTAGVATKSFHFQGDSILYGTGSSNNRTITQALSTRLASSVLIRNNAIAGTQLSGAWSSYNSAATRSRYVVDSVENTYVSNYGHNDIKALVTDASTATSVVATMQTQIKSMCADLRLAGYARIIWQEAFRDASGSWTADMENARLAWNTFLNSNPIDTNGAACFDAIDKVATDTNFILSDAETTAGRGMALTANSNDGVHPNEGSAGARADHLLAAYNAIGVTQPGTPTVTLSAPVTQNEGNSGPALFTYTVTRSSTTGATSVPWTFAAGTTSADDFTGGSYPAGGSVALADGVASGSFSVSVNGDTTVEGTESFTVSITAPSGYASGANMTAAGTVTSDDISAGPVIASTTDSFSATDVTAFNVTLPATVNAGDLLIAGVAVDGGSALTWDNTTAGAWAASLNDTQTANRFLVFTKVADGTEGGKTLALTIAAAQQLVVRVFRITGTTGAFNISLTGARFVASLTGDPLAITASWGAANNLFIAMAGIDNAASITSGPSGYSTANTLITSASGQAGISTAFKVANAASDDPGVFTSSTSIAFICATVVVRPA